jgi:NAD(P)-dependent dehydrogenase (short-subunit alcohol dehydrogenase family)
MPAGGGLEGRVALITGASRGIGRGVAVRLAADGADIAVNYRDNEQAAAETVRLVEALGRRARAYRASVDSWDADVAMTEAVRSDFGFVDILVCNGGPTGTGQTVVDTDAEVFVSNMSTHASGATYLCKLLVPQMRQRPRGDIVVMSSISTSFIGAHGAPYNMAKVALEALAVTLAAEEQQHGIRVNIVAPGMVATDMGDRYARMAAGVARATDLDSTAPFGRVCRVEDVAGVVAFLVSADGFYVTGQRIGVDGGQGLL